MIFSKKKRSPGIILIFTLFSLALLSMIFVYCLENRMHRERFYSLAMKAGGFLDVKKNGKDLEVDVRGLLDLERWSMLNYLSACFYNFATDPGSYKWYKEEIKNYETGALSLFCSYTTGNASFSITDDKFSYRKNRYSICSILKKKEFKKIEDCVEAWVGGPLPIEYSDAVKGAKSVENDDIVHNSNLKVEAKINLADNKLPFNEKFKKEALNALYECIETAYPVSKNKNFEWEKGKKKTKFSKDNFGAETIVEKVGKLIEDYHKKRKGYTLTFSDLMSIDELRLLIQGNFEDDVLKEYEWAKDGFKEENAKELEALIRDTFVFYDIYAVNFLLANKFVQDAFIKVNIPTEFSSNSPGFVGRYKTVDHRLRNVGRNICDETDTTGKYIVTDTADSMYFFDGIESLSEADLVKFLGQEFYKDYTGGLNSKFKEKIQGLDATLDMLRNDQLAYLYVKIYRGSSPSINKPEEKKQVLKEIAGGIRNVIRILLKCVLKDRYKLYYGGDVNRDARMVIEGTSAGSNSYKKLSPDEKRFSEAFDYLALEGETGRLASLSDRELKLVRGRDKNQDINGIINMCIEEDDGIMNLQILKILCKKLSVFCAKDEEDQKLYLFPYPWNDDLKVCDVGSICDISDNGIKHTTYYYDYLGDDGNVYDSKSRLEYEFDKKIGVMSPILSKHAQIDKDHKHSLLLKDDVLTDEELNLDVRSVHDVDVNPWDRVRNFCSFSNYANVKLRIYDDSLKFIRKETDDVICFDVPNDLKLALFKKDSGGKYERGSDGKIKFISNGGFHIEPITKWNYDNP